MSADPEIMEFFDRPLTAAESETAIETWRARTERDGFGMMALTLRADGSFIGVAGIQRIPYEAPFTPAVEIGWRLARLYWGQGYATESAQAAMAYGLGPLGLREIVAVAVAANRQSLAVMERIGMIRDMLGDFDHPRVTPGHRWQRHILYRKHAEP